MIRASIDSDPRPRMSLGTKALLVVGGALVSWGLVQGISEDEPTCISVGKVQVVGGNIGNTVRHFTRVNPDELPVGDTDSSVEATQKAQIVATGSGSVIANEVIDLHFCGDTEQTEQVVQLVRKTEG